MAFTLPDNDEAFNTNQSIWMQTDINAIIAAINGDGVVSGCVVSEDGGGASMDLDVTAGSVQISDTTYSITGGAAAATISTAHGTNPRIDLVCANTSSILTVTAGTAAVNPKAPDIPANSVLLAMVYVPASDTTIADNQIIDKRIVVKQVVAASASTILTHTVIWEKTLSGAGLFDTDDAPDIGSTGLESGYDYLIIRGQIRSATSGEADNCGFLFNNDFTQANYFSSYLMGFDTTTAHAEADTPFYAMLVPGATATANTFGIIEFIILDYESSKIKNVEGLWSFRGTTTLRRDGIGGLDWESAAAITRIEVGNDGAENFATGSWLQIIGVKAETVYTT